MLTFALILTTLHAASAVAASPQPERIRAISRKVFGDRWRTAACIAHRESTDGAYLLNGRNVGPWQIDVYAHPWVDARRLLTDWLYAAQVAYRISSGGRDWSPWSTRGMCHA